MNLLLLIFPALIGFVLVAGSANSQRGSGAVICVLGASLLVITGLTICAILIILTFKGTL